jgi:hypothetical protein
MEQPKPKPKLRPVCVENVYTHLQIDITTPDKASDDGSRYLINTIDIFSKYAWAYPSQHKDAASVLLALQEIVGDHGRFPILQHDNGGEFVNKVIEEFCSLNQIRKLSCY